MGLLLGVGSGSQNYGKTLERRKYADWYLAVSGSNAGSSTGLMGFINVSALPGAGGAFTTFAPFLGTEIPRPWPCSPNT
jgi:hypothetical protein